MGKSQRIKGSVYERDVCHAIEDATGIKVNRNIGQSRDGGDDITLPPYRIECKRRASISTYVWMDQCAKSCGPTDVPVVIARGDGRESLVVMRFDDWIKLAMEEICKK